jgi:Tol biopolymer transport system component
MKPTPFASLLVLFLLGAGPVLGQATERVSLSAASLEPDDDCYEAVVSADGRFVAFTSGASNMIPGVTGGHVWVRDRLLGTLELVSVSTGGVPANGVNESPSISADGRYVAFESSSGNLVPADTNATWDVFLRDRQLGTTTRVSLSVTGQQLNGASFQPVLTPDGDYLAFVSQATNVVAGFAGTIVYRLDLVGGQMTVVSASPTGSPNGICTAPAISHDGRFIAFESTASNLVAGDANGFKDVFIRDCQLGVTDLVSVATGGAPANNDSALPSLSADGNEVVFLSRSTNFFPGDVNNSYDVFVRDRASLTTTRINIAAAGGIPSPPTRPVVSATGRLVAYVSGLSLVPADTNFASDVYVYDRVAGTTSLESASTAGVVGNFATPSNLANFQGRNALSISADGEFVAFDSEASNLVEGDNAGFRDVFVRWRGCHAWFTAFGAGLAGSGNATPYLAAVEGSCYGGWALIAVNVVGGASGYLGVATASIAPALPILGGSIYLDIGQPFFLVPITASGPAGVPGAGTWLLTSVDTASIHGSTFFHQAAFLDPAAPQGWSLTNAVEAHY